MSTRRGSCLIYVVPVLALILYLAFPSRQYDYDVLTELINIERGILRIGDPAHPLYSWVGWVWYSLWKSLGYSNDSMYPMQVFNAICGSVALLVFQLILIRFGVNRTSAMLTTVGAGLSYSFWTHTVDAFFIIPAAMCALGALHFALGAAESDRARAMAVVAGLAIAVSTLFYQVSLLLLPALFAAAYHPRHSRRAWVMVCLVMSATAIGLVGIAWGLQAASTGRVASMGDVVAWLSGAHGGMDTGLWRRDGVPLVSTTAQAWVGTILPLYEGLRVRSLLQGDISFSHLAAQLALLLLALIVLGIILTVVIRVRQQTLSRAGASRLPIIIGLWFLLSGCTVVWFDRAEVKLWLIPMFAFWMTCGLALSYWLATVQRRQTATWLVASAAIFLLSMGLGNFSLAILPDATVTRPEMRAARALAREMRPEDVAISATADWILYVEYLCATCRFLYVMDSVQQLGRDQQSRLEQLIKDEVASTLARGGRVFVPDYFARGDDPAWTIWVERFTGLTLAQFAQFEYPVAVELDGVVIRQLRRPAGSN